MEHGGDADARAEMLRIGGDRQHGLRCGLEQKVIDERLVVKGDLGDLGGGQREDDMELSHRQQVSPARGKPCACGNALALRAVPVTAGVIGDAPLFTSLDMPTQCGRSAMLDRGHHLEVGQAEMPLMG